MSLKNLGTLLLVPSLAMAQAAAPIGIAERSDMAIGQPAVTPTHGLRLTLAHFAGGGWAREDIVGAVAQGAAILEQCGVAIEKTELLLIDAPPRYRYFDTAMSRELARTLDLPKPTIYFVAGTRQQPAFDAEAIGRGNSRSRPELADTVWVARGTRDLGIALVHELAHVLMDSGEHSAEPGNLMSPETAPGNTRLSGAQCARLRETGSANGLLGLRR